jgi:N-acetyltransferase
LLDRQPVLEGELLLLRPLCAEDWDALFTVASDPLIWELHPAHDRWREDVFCAFFDDALAQAGALAVIDKASGRIIGSSRFQGLEPENGGSVEIGWTFLAREYWGGTFNREMKWLMLDHALASVAECRFAVGEKNLRSRRALEKIGARLSERVDERAMAGGIVRHVHYVINREDFMRSGLSQPGSC